MVWEWIKTHISDRGFWTFERIFLGFYLTAIAGGCLGMLGMFALVVLSAFYEYPWLLLALVLMTGMVGLAIWSDKSQANIAKHLNNTPVDTVKAEVGAAPPEDDELVFIEGEPSEVRSIRYERNRMVRRHAIKVHGRICRVCGFDFNAVYGPEVADGYIEVHHITPLSEVGPREINIQRDVLPVCANCHRMIHRRSPPFSADEIKVQLRSSTAPRP